MNEAQEKIAGADELELVAIYSRKLAAITAWLTVIVFCLGVMSVVGSFAVSAVLYAFADIG